MLERILIGGSGGQGIVLIGKLLASVAVNTYAHVTFFPAYGAEVRGGASNCQVMLSDREIASPVAEVFDSLLIMNQESAERYMDCCGPDPLVIVNRSLCRIKPAPGVVSVPVTDLANELGDTRAANFLMLGAYLARRPVVPPEAVRRGTEALLADKGRAVIDLNLRAFEAGLKS